MTEMLSGFTDADPFFIIRTIAVFAMLLIGSISDIKNRQVSDFLWIVFGVISSILILTQTLFFDNFQILLITGLSMLFLVPISYILYRVGFFGGADALGIIVFSVLWPYSATGIIGLNNENQITSPFTIVTNAALVSLSALIFNAFVNLRSLLNKKDIFEGFEHESVIRKAIAFFLGIRVNNPKYGFSIQQTIAGKHKFNFTLHNSETSEFCTTPWTWITPAMPFIVYLTIGFMIQIAVGDLILLFFSLFL